MPTCSVRWRPSGGRGEFEFVPAETLEDRTINVLFEHIGVTIPAEVRGVKAQGKPRLRRFSPFDRSKLHLPQLVMAVARLPDPAREDITHTVSFPLENKSFVMDEMEFDIVEDDGIIATITPLRVSILHSNFQIEFSDRLKGIAQDFANIGTIVDANLAEAIKEHASAVYKAVNSKNIRIAADKVAAIQQKLFGMTNAGSITALQQIQNLPNTEEEEPVAIEGRLLTRLHVYRERDKTFAAQVKKNYKAKYGKLTCEACGLDPVAVYGPSGERCIEAHHKIPIEELQPDSVTRVDDMAIVCASCHRVIHSVKPCLTIDGVLPKSANGR